VCLKKRKKLCGNTRGLFPPMRIIRIVLTLFVSDVRNHFGWDIQEEDSHSQHVRDVSEDVPVPEPVEEEPVHVRTFHVYEAIKMPS